MKHLPLTIVVVGALIVVEILPKITLAICIGQEVQVIADQLVAEQVPEGVSTGNWPKEVTFTGSIIAGVVDTFIPSSGEDAPYWNGKKPFEDQLDLLSGHQVAEGQPGAGSFYWQSHHGDGGLSNWTEVTMFATLGLVAALKANPALNLDCAILAAHDALLGSVSYQGMVWERLSQEDKDYYEYAREILNT